MSPTLGDCSERAGAWGPRSLDASPVGPIEEIALRLPMMPVLTLTIGIVIGAIGATALNGQQMPVKETDIFRTDLAGLKGKELLCDKGGGRRRIVGVYPGGQRLRFLLQRLGSGDPSTVRGPSRSPPGSDRLT
jgi:hypothetical protein